MICQLASTCIHVILIIATLFVEFSLSIELFHILSFRNNENIYSYFGIVCKFASMCINNIISHVPIRDFTNVPIN